MNTVDATSSWTGLGNINPGGWIPFERQHQRSGSLYDYATDLDYEKLQTRARSQLNTNGTDAVLPLVTVPCTFKDTDLKLDGIAEGAAVNPNL